MTVLHNLAAAPAAGAGQWRGWVVRLQSGAHCAAEEDTGAHADKLTEDVDAHHVGVCLAVSAYERVGLRVEPQLQSLVKGLAAPV